MSNSLLISQIMFMLVVILVLHMILIGILLHVASGFSTAYTKVTTGDGLWGLDAQGVTYNVIGNNTYTLTGGVDYSANKGMAATLGDLMTSYNEFSNKDDIES